MSQEGISEIRRLGNFVVRGVGVALVVAGGYLAVNRGTDSSLVQALGPEPTPSGNARALYFPRLVNGPASENAPTPNPTSTPTETPSPVPTAVPASISTCREITQGGSYILNRDLVTKSGSCIDFQYVDSVNIDCQGHSISAPSAAMVIEDSKNFVVKNCSLEMVGSPNYSGGVLVTRSSGALINNRFKNWIQVSSSQDIRVIGNYFEGYYQQLDSSRSDVEYNTFVTTVAGMDAAIVSKQGRDNIFSNNVVSGGWGGDPNYQLGTDKGISITSETGDTIAHNSISNILTGGIDLSGSISNVRVTDNYLSMIDGYGVGGHLYGSWQDMTVERNVANQTISLFDFQRIGPLLWTTDQVFFQDNAFRDNKLQQPLSLKGKSVSIDMQHLDPSIPLSKVHLGNNTFAHNDFGTEKEVEIIPGSMVVDGNGNICAQSTDSQATALNCHDYTTVKLSGTEFAYYNW